MEPAGFDDFARSLASGKREKNARMSGSICDALMANSPGMLTFAIGQRTMKGGLVVTDDEARDAMRFAYHELKLVLEPGGAAALAAVLAGKLQRKGRTIACVLSGGNVDPVDFAEIITRRLEAGRISPGLAAGFRFGFERDGLQDAVELGDGAVQARRHFAGTLRLRRLGDALRVDRAGMLGDLLAGALVDGDACRFQAIWCICFDRFQDLARRRLVGRRAGFARHADAGAAIS